MKILILVIILAVLAYIFILRSGQPNIETSSEFGNVNDLSKYFDTFQNSKQTFNTLIISVKDSGDFLQFSRNEREVEIDFPLISDRQKSLETTFRNISEEQGLIIREVIGSDNSKFLDADLPQSTEGRSNVVKNILINVFDITEQKELEFILN